MHELGMDRPMVMRYLSYIGGILRRFRHRKCQRPDHPDSSSRCFRRAELSICAIVFAIVLRHFRPASSPPSSASSFFDQSVMGVALVGYSMPIFWWGLSVIIPFAGILQWTPVSGRISMYFFPGHRLHADRSAAVGAERCSLPALSHPIPPSASTIIPLAVIARRDAFGYALKFSARDYVAPPVKGLSTFRVIGDSPAAQCHDPVITTSACRWRVDGRRYL